MKTREYDGRIQGRNGKRHGRDLKFSKWTQPPRDRILSAVRSSTDWSVHRLLTRLKYHNNYWMDCSESALKIKYIAIIIITKCYPDILVNQQQFCAVIP